MGRSSGSTRLLLSSVLGSLLLVAGGLGAGLTGADEARAASPSGGVAPTGLTVGQLPSPVDVDNLTAPQLGWHVGAGMQTGYQIQVSTATSDVPSPDVWDSGKVGSTENANIAYRGPALTASSGYVWRVRTWDGLDRASDWSVPARFGTGPGGTWAGATPIWTTGIPGGWGDSTFSGTFDITSSKASVTFRDQDTRNLYLWQWSATTIAPQVEKNGVFSNLKPAQAYPTSLGTNGTLSLNTNYDFKIVAAGSTYLTYTKPSSGPTWTLIDTTVDSTYSSGGIGIRTGSSETYTLDNLLVTNVDGTTAYANDFSDSTNRDFSCGTVAAGVLSVPKSQNCVYSGGGTTSNNWAFLRGDVTLRSAPVAWAHLYVAASSTAPARQFVAKTSINGTVVGVGPSRPVGSETRYDGYDVTALVRPGEVNTVSALAYATTDQRYQAQLVVAYRDGTSQTFSTRPGWKALNGSFAYPDGGSIGTSYYTAPKENIQASDFPFGYDEPGFVDSTWPAATPKPAFTNLVATPVAKVQEQLKTPASVVEYSPGNYFIDYGRTWIGGVSLDLSGQAGEVVDIRYGQVTSAPDTVKYATSAGNSYEDRWTLRAGDNKLETWGPRVFRYVNVLNAPTGLTAADFPADAYIYPFDPSLNVFASASTNLDQVWQLSKNTIESLDLNGFVDSYERERGFYEADDYIQQMSNLYTGGDSTLGTYSTLFLLANRTWPTEWPFYAILSLHDTYMATGDTSVMAANYAALQSKLPDRWYDPASGLIHKTIGINGCTSTDCDIVDWPAGDRDGYVFTAYNTVINAISYRAYTDMAGIAAALGKTSDAATYAARAKTIKDGLNAIMWNAAQGAYSDGSSDGSTAVAHWSVQASAFAVAMGVAEPAQAAAAASYLGRRGMACSVYCADFMLQAAYDGNNPAVGTGFMTSTATNSWMAMIDQGAGATMEAWNPVDKSNLTYSHPWASGPASDIPQYMFGINPTAAGYDTFDIRPQSTPAVPWGHITIPTPKGEVGAAYDMSAGRTDVGAYVPPNSTARVFVPDENAADTSVYVDGIAAPATNVNGFLQVDDVTPGCHVLSTSADPGAYRDTDLTAICPAGYQANQTINFGPIPDHTYLDPDFTITATASSGLPVDLTAAGSCEITDARVHLTGAGTCRIVATQPGDSTFAAAAGVTQSFTIAKASQVIAFADLADRTVGGADFVLTATASSGLPVQYTVTGVCAVDGGTVHVPDVGTCTITASQPGDTNYLAAAHVTRTLRVVYGVTVITDLSKPVRRGATLPLILQLVDAGGTNMSTSSIVVHAIGVDGTSTPPAPGSSQPGQNFSFGHGAYQYNLKTTGLSGGQHTLTYTAGGDPSTHMITFTVTN